MTRRLSALLALLVVTPVPAFAHAALVHAEPAVGSTVSSSPGAVTLTFSEGVVPRLSDISIRDASGKPVKAGRATGSGVSLHAQIQGRLAAGMYTVTWRAVSVDTHHTQGHFIFTVAP